MNVVKKAKKVFVGLSGGVDSSVAALRLIRQGYDVTGVFIKVWQPDFLKCNAEEERLDAMRVAAHLEIPFLTCDAEDIYKKEVGDYFISEYEQGRTPNPDVMCNKYVKFGAFLNFARERGADFVATGHYARVVKKGSCYSLFRGIDEEKDQSYFLWTLTQKELAQILFPVGDTKKVAIRNEAQEAKLPTAIKKDSQGICFLGQVDIPEFLSHFIDLKPGQVLDKTGIEIGTHKGALTYTLGQRHGFLLRTKNQSQKPMFVIARDLKNNTLTVDEKLSQLEKNSDLSLRDVNWINPFENNTSLSVQFRYRQKPITISVEKSGLNQATLKLKEDTQKPPAGQSAVIYDGFVCLGGGIIAA